MDGSRIADKYDIYVRNGLPFSIARVLEFPPDTYLRVAFADELKKDIAHKLNTTVDFIEQNKDCIISDQHLLAYGSKLKRDARYRGCGMRNRLLWGGGEAQPDSNYWVRHTAITFQSAQDETCKNIVPVVTDFRFLNEKTFADMVGRTPVTIRVRSIWGINTVKSDVSERSLDDYNPDMILTPKGTDLSVSPYPTHAYEKYIPHSL